MVKRQTIARFFLYLALIWPTLGWSDEYILQKIPADQLEKGCFVDFYAIDAPGEQPAIGRSNYSIYLRWSCNGKPARPIDTYEIEGGSPEIVTVLFRKKKDTVVLVKWTTTSPSADFQGDFYKIYVYRYTPENSNKPLKRQENAMSKLGDGWEGTMNGREVHYPFKDAYSIRRELNRLGY
jgi:hypothetical protein